MVNVARHGKLVMILDLYISTAGIFILKETPAISSSSLVVLDSVGVMSRGVRLKYLAVVLSAMLCC